MKIERIALKPYLETIEHYCDGLSKVELKEIIKNLAKGVPASDRIAFLASLESYVPGLKKSSAQISDPVEEILNGIEALKESIVERAIAIEDGSFWDDPDFYEDDYEYSDEIPDTLSDELGSELISFFDDAGHIFLEDRLVDARRIYEALFNLINEVKKFDDYFVIEEFDFKEAMARYCRSVYDTSKKESRLDEFANAMDIDHSRLDPELQYDEDFPLMQDVIDAQPGEMEDMEAFLLSWKEILKKKGINSRSSRLLLEAVYLTEGIPGVSKLARKWNKSQPMGYLFWLKVLNSENKQEEIISIGKEALKVLDVGRSREQVAEFMIESADELDVRNYRLLGRREKFLSHHNDNNLLNLIAEAIRQNKRDEELEKVIDFFKDRKCEREEKELYVKCLLMGGKFNEAVAMAANEKSIGWSYGSVAGVVFGAVLSVHTDHSVKAGAVKSILKNYANKTSIYSGEFSVNDGTEPSFYSEIIKGLSANENVKSQAKDFLLWAEKIGKNRIDHIVSNKHRKAYERAAKVLGALAETYVVIGKPDKAKKIIHRFYAEKYNRHSAFRREVQNVINHSDILRNMKLI